MTAPKAAPTSVKTARRLACTSALALAVALAGCTVGPNYQRPTAAPSTHFKEADGWTPAHPIAELDKGAWWSVFNDPVLDGLEQRVNINNQNIAQAVAAYRQAHQITAEARAQFFPTISADGDITDQKSGGRGGGVTTTAGGTTVVTSGNGGGGITTYSASLDATWAPDLWGRVRRTVEGDVATAQAQAADIANARLSAQADLASDYWGLRVNDAQQQLFRDTVAAYQRFLTLTQNQYAAGVAARSAVLSAQTQLLGAQAELVDLQTQRALFEHAIAVLLGLAPSEFALAPMQMPSFDVPVAPTVLPSTLLERRPDIAAAERLAKNANAQIGVQESAFYPTLNLTGSYGYAASNLGSLFNASNELWSVGGQLAETLIDFGARRAAVRAARAAYDQQVAVYRQTVLTAFQGVEDELVTLRVLQQEATVREQAKAAADLAVKLALNQYKAGQVDYTTVIDAQTTALADDQQVLTVQQQRLQASVVLIQDLGGGWRASDLPKG